MPVLHALLNKSFAEGRLRSAPCRQRDFSRRWYRAWVSRIAAGAAPLAEDQNAVWGFVWAAMQGKGLHRKLWEWAAISQALAERGMLRPGKRGIGFAVGHEPLPSLFAAFGSLVLASDLDVENEGSKWNSTGQLAASLEAVHWPGLIDKARFQQRVFYQNIDMRDLAGLPGEGFDFSWSSCAFEHLGSLHAGMEFICRSVDLLRPGGVAVHTTEFNCTSNDETVESGDNVIYRRRDIEALDFRLRKMGCGIESLDFDPGADPHDLDYDRPPYYSTGRQHVKLSMLGHVSTSILLIVRKGG